MKKLWLSASLLFVFFSVFLLQGCIKDTYSTTYTYTMYKPVYKTKAEVRDGIKSSAATELDQTGKLYIYGSFIFLNEVDKGIHVINNADPSHPQNVAFIDIPGNRDLAVKGNYLYADLYTDLVVIDISNPNDVKLKNVVENVFPHRYYDSYFTSDSSRVIVNWTQKDTTVTIKGEVGRWWEKDYLVFNTAQGGEMFSGRGNMAAAPAASPIGMGGSMARFALVNQNLYTVGMNELNVFNISTPQSPAFTSTQQIGWNIETIFPFQQKLFIGSNSGMFIYDISNPNQPVKQSQFSHVQSCDPVIADDKYAYVTLRSGTVCQGFTNQLEVLDIANIQNPQLLKVYQMTNPHGLSKDEDYLFICDGAAGLKVYDAKDVNNLKLLKTIGNMETYDVIAWNSVALVVAKDGLYQFDYSNISNIRLLSKISLKN